ncbi:hypothetical protein ACH5RR_021669 [Cinchona calisaya]|uniref:Uncharacterized protein n=1 Tax=Cinchona calisaya TaxID=153742 RepID=A0ABD2ZHY9_9GENT
MIPCPYKKCMNSNYGTLRETIDDDNVNDDLGNDMAIDDIDKDDNAHQVLKDIWSSAFTEIGNCGSKGSPQIDKSQEDDIARFDKLLQDVDRKLYPGCKLPLLSSFLKLLHVKVINKWSRKC